MMILLCLLVPFLSGLLCLRVRGDRPRRRLAVAGSGLSLLAAASQLPALLTDGPASLSQANWGWLRLDPKGLWTILVCQTVSVLASLYAVGYLDRSARDEIDLDVEASHLPRTPEALFSACFLFLQAAMALVCLAHHLGLLWVAVEATTLASAPLVFHHRDGKALEATWKYLVVCSTGLAIALLGTFFIAVAAYGHSSLDTESLLRTAPLLDKSWLTAGFLLLAVGYGTKLGLAPLHGWLPDAYGEAPSPASAVLSGALSACSFLALSRGVEIAHAAGLGSMTGEVLRLLGLASLLTASVFLFGQKDVKRLLAWSSVEQGGLLVFALGAGAPAAAFLQLASQGLAKTAGFLSASNLIRSHATPSIGGIRGCLRSRPISARLWLGAILALSGMVPFGTFAAEFLTAQSAMASGNWLSLGLWGLLLLLIFAATLQAVLPMLFGPPSVPQAREPLWSVLPGIAALVLCALAILLPPLLGPQLSGWFALP
jgi:hydrogenase-4 component F